MPSRTQPLAVHPEALKPGEFVGQYEILEMLDDSGGMGCIYKVRRGKGLYAIKILKEYFLDDDSNSAKQQEDRVRADREFFCLRSVDHPNVLRAYGFDRWPEPTRGWPYIVTEYVDGADIYDWSREQHPSLRRIVTVLSKVTGALDSIHKANLFHRDLKAPNILVRRENDEPVLIDLGIARHAGLEPVTVQRVLGTSTNFAPEYVEYLDSPSAFSGEPFTWTVKVDLYGLGYVAYEVVTGRPPVVSCGGEQALLSAIKSEPVPDARGLNAAVPESLSAVIMSLLEKDPSKRPDSADAVQRSIDAVLSSEEGLDGEFLVPLAPPQEAVTEAHPPPSFLPTWMRDQMRSLPFRKSTPPPVEAQNGNLDDTDDLEETIVHLDDEELQLSDAENAPGEEGVKGERGVSTAIRQAKEILAASTPKRRLSPRVLMAAGAAAVVLLLIVISSGGGRKQVTQKDDLLAKVEKAQAEAKRYEGSQPVASASQSPQEMSVVPAGMDQSSPPGTPLQPNASDAVNIDKALAERFGRPVVNPDGETSGELPPGTVPPPSEPPTNRPKDKTRVATRRSPSNEEYDPLGHADRGVSAQSSANGEPKRYGIPMGSRIRAKLLSNLDSRTNGEGMIEAMLTVPFILRGKVIFPARTMLYGQANDSRERFSVKFTSIRLPDDTEVKFEGIAYDRGDNKPGLTVGARISSGSGSNEESVGSQVARGTGNILLNTVTGGIAEDITRNAGSTAVNNRSTNYSRSSGEAVLLDGGVVFDVFVTRAF